MTSIRRGIRDENIIKGVLEKFYSATCHGTAGAKNEPDIVVEINGIKTGIEVKGEKATECGQKKFSLKEGILFLGESIHLRILDIFHQNRIPEEYILFDGQIPLFLTQKKISEKEWKTCLDTFKLKVEFPKGNYIAEYYRGKGSSYIQLGDKGLFSTGEDPFGWKVPILETSGHLRIRCKKHSKTSFSLMACLVCDLKSVISSPMNLYQERKMKEKDGENEGEKGEGGEEEVNFSEMNVKELKNLCKERGIKGYSSKKRNELLELLGEKKEEKKNLEEEKKEEKIISPLRYPGGKSRAIKILQNILKENFPNETILISPFFGGGSFELSVSDKYKIKANDIFYPLFCFWKELQNNSEKLGERVARIVDKKEIDKEIFKELRIFEGKSSMQIAARYYLINRCSFSGATFCGGFSKQAYDGRLNQSIFDRMVDLGPKIKEIEFSNLDWEDFLEGNQEGVIYLDPPYYITNYLYGKNGDLHENFDHQRLAKYLLRKKKWFMSYNDCPEIRELYPENRIISAEWSYGMNSSKKSNEIIIFSQ